MRTRRRSPPRTYWTSVEHVVDVGGRCAAADPAAAHPHLRGTLFDRPQVVESVDQTVASRRRCRRPLPPQAPERRRVRPLQILHGFLDDGAAQILERCAQAGGDSARILLVEALHLAERRTRRASTSSCSRSWAGASGHSRTSGSSPSTSAWRSGSAAPSDLHFSRRARLPHVGRGRA